MANNYNQFLLLLLPLLLHIHYVRSELQLNYYSESCPRAEEIIKEQVAQLYHKHGNTAVSWIRNLFHDCMAKSCDASIYLDTANGQESEKASPKNFGMRNLKYVLKRHLRVNVLILFLVLILLFFLLELVFSG
ncbi:peroxidase 21 [Nicotiana tabacum]|uniref:Peroxidase 21 n=3 Tax=Nicotiana TaxID=4085 RepID=A0AC58S107_TOBAC|nr:PREDICTED: peroxidase 21-like [Nicotiana sylvestris]XP_016456264.1 PREDICTED: peroxidase 21-like [Nicotiana tabacum]